MRGSTLRSRQTLGDSATVGGLPVDGEIAFTIRLEHDATTIRRPDRESVFRTKRRPPRCRRPDHVVDPDILVVTNRTRYEQPPVRRHTRMFVGPGREEHTLNGATPVCLDHFNAALAEPGRARHVHEGAGL